MVHPLQEKIAQSMKSHANPFPCNIPACFAFCVFTITAYYLNKQYFEYYRYLLAMSCYLLAVWWVCV